MIVNTTMIIRITNLKICNIEHVSENLNYETISEDEMIPEDEAMFGD